MTALPDGWDEKKLAHAASRLAMYASMLELDATSRLGEDIVRTMVIKQHVEHAREMVREEYGDLMEWADSMVSDSINEHVEKARKHAEKSKAVKAKASPRRR